MFKADTATVLFYAAKAGKLSRGFQDCEQIGSFEKSGVRGALGAARYRRERIERRRDGWRGIQRGSGIYAHDREGGLQAFTGGWRGGWASMTLGGRGGQTSARVHMDGLMHVQPTDADVVKFLRGALAKRACPVLDLEASARAAGLLKERH